MPGILERLKEAAAYAQAKKLEAQRKIQMATGGGYAAQQREIAFDAKREAIDQRIQGALANQAAEHPKGLPAAALEAYYRIATTKRHTPGITPGSKTDPEAVNGGEL